MEEVSQVPGMQITKNREEGAISISRTDYAMSVLKEYWMAEFNWVYRTGTVKIKLNQLEGKLLDQVGTTFYQTINELLLLLGLYSR